MELNKIIYHATGYTDVHASCLEMFGYLSIMSLDPIYASDFVHVILLAEPAEEATKVSYIAHRYQLHG